MDNNATAIHRILGKHGRTTIPLALRRRLGWQSGDPIRFRLEAGQVIITRETGRAAEAPDLAKLLAQLVFALTGGGGNG